MKYKKAEYFEVMKCPCCGFYKAGEDDGMPDKEDFMHRTDKQGIDYIECPCGCKFVERDSGTKIKKHKCVYDPEEWGFNIRTGEKDFFCKICQKKIATIKVKKK